MVEPSGDKVRDMVWFEAYEGYEVVEEIVDGASIIENTKTENETHITYYPALHQMLHPQLWILKMIFL